jgi:TonB-linked SusC/RagA family outer membrane protein
MTKPAIYHKKIQQAIRFGSYLILFAVLFGSAAFAEASYDQKILEKKITLRFTGENIVKALEKIESTAKVKFVYNPFIFTTNFRVHVNFKNESLSEILDEILIQDGIDYEAIGNHIILKKHESKTGRPINSARPAERTITGKVTDESGETLPGVSIAIKGTQNGTLTNELGIYTLSLPEDNATLVFSYVGYVNQEVVTGSRTTLDVVMSKDTKLLDEVMVVGYGTVKKSDLTGSVARVNAESFQNQSATQLTEMLSGTVAGFTSNQSAGAAGGGSMEIRGPNSLSGGSSPLVVLDGVIYNGSIRDINPNDIETIDILKDASSAAVYGSRAASGVIIVTTKKGKTGAPTINFTSKFGISQPTHARRPFGPEEYVKFRQSYFRTVFPNTDYNFYTNPNELPADVSLDQWRKLSANPQEDNLREWMGRMRFFPIEQENYLANKTTNWYNEVIRKAKSQDYDVSIGGQTENFSYYWSLGYLKNEGVLLGDQYSNVRSRINADYKIVDWLKVGVNAQFSDRDEGGVPASLGFYANSPYGQMFDAEGNLIRLAHGHTDNPLLDYYRKDRLRKINSLFANLHADLTLPLGITYRISFQPRYESMKDFSFTSTDIKLGGLPSEISQGSREEYSHYEWMVDNLLKWYKEVGAHKFDVTFLYNVEESNRWGSKQTNRNFSPSEKLGYHGLQFGDGPAISNNDYKSTGDALMGRLNYTLMDKYLFTASIRRDGFSAFGQENPRAVFPALAFAWRISDEEFFKSNLIKQLKLRTSWGINGNRDIGIYASMAVVNSNLWYDGSNTRVGVFNSTLANSGLKWERTESVNIGADITLANNLVDLSLDYYDMTTKDLLLDRNLPTTTGFSSITSNLGELGNRGFEMTLNTTNVKNSNFTWNTSLNFSLNRNKIKELFGNIGNYTLLGENRQGEIPDFTNQWFPGQPMDVVWDYKPLGVWQVNETDEAKKYGMRPGDFKSVDVNGDGVYTDLVDKQFIGYTSPRYRLGFSNNFTFFKYFTASVFIRADLGHIGRYDNALHAGWESNDRWNRNVGPVPYWTPENPINDYARLDLTTSGYGGGLRIYRPRSFVRVQDVTLAYNVPSKIVKRLLLNNIRAFGALRNCLTFTKWPNWDPESGSLPLPKSVTIGLSLTI